MSRRKNPTFPGPDIETMYKAKRTAYKNELEQERKPGTKRSKPWERKNSEKEEVPFFDKPKHREDYEELEEDLENYKPHASYKDRN